MIIGAIFAVLFIFYMLGRNGSHYRNGHYTGRPMLPSRRIRNARRYARNGSAGRAGIGRRVARSILLRGIF